MAEQKMITPQFGVKLIFFGFEFWLGIKGTVIEKHESVAQQLWRRLDVSEINYDMI
jgi:hypothetical protein